MPIFVSKIIKKYFDSNLMISFINENSNLTETEERDLNSFMLNSNILRDLLACSVLLITNIVMLFVDIFVNKRIFKNPCASDLLSYSRILYIIFSTIFIISFSRHKNRSKLTNKKLKGFHHSFLLVSLLWAIFMTLNATALHNQISAFLITLFTLSFFITLSFYERIFFIIFPTLFLDFGLSILSKDPDILLGNLLNTAFACVLCLLISNIHEFFLKNYIAKSIKLTKRNKELLDIKSQLEFEVERRSEELTNAHNMVLTEILESHSYELELLKSHMELEKNTRKLKEIESYEKLRTEFFANISHELKTPLNVIFSAQQLLNKNLNEDHNTNNVPSSSNSKNSKYLNIIRQNCYRLIRLIGNLIDLTKFDSGYLSVDLSNNNIVEIIEDITLSVASFIEEKNITLIFDTTVEDLVISCDPENIERIVLNLLSNSIKFTPECGTISVHVSEKDEWVIVSVSDTGIGIPKEIQPNIFDRFVQADKSIKRNHEGSGIGLSLVKSLIDLHSGKVYLESEEDKGTKITFLLPKKLAPISANSDSSISSREYSYNEHVEKISIEFSDIYS